MNFVFISPNFPKTYWNFCARLAENGANVLGVGDCPFDELCDELKGCLTEYYRVDNMTDYDQVFRAVAFFSFRYGKIDWIESNNEFWLEQDARLRDDFNVRTGATAKQVAAYKSKSGMKAYYAKAGVPSARCHVVSDRASALAFIDEVGGYPVFAKPDCGVGAEGTYKIDNEADLDFFLADKPDEPYAMEEFVTGEIYSYDAIVDSKGKPLFENSCQFPPSMAEIVANRLDCVYRALPKVPTQLRQRGRATVKAFDVRSRFVHLEFFRLTQDKPGLGVVGDFVGLEVNMRPAGGYTPDIMNIAHATDVYRIYADMVCHDERMLPPNNDNQYCLYVGRRDGVTYRHTTADVLEAYSDLVETVGRIPEALSNDLGNWYVMLRVPTEEQCDKLAEWICDRSAPDDAEDEPVDKAQDSQD